MSPAGSRSEKRKEDIAAVSETGAVLLQGLVDSGR